MAVEDALRLLRDHGPLGAFDAVLAAASLRAGCRALVSADRAFAQVAGMTVVFPNQDGIATLHP